MRIVEAHTQGEGRAGGLTLGSVASRLAAYRCDTSGEAGAVVGLLAELLLGAEDPRWANAPWAPGEATLAVDAGRLRLRRTGGRRGASLTLSTVGPRPASAPTAGPRDWQQGLPSAVLGTVFFASGDAPGSLVSLLSPQVAQEFTRLASRRERLPETAPSYQSSSRRSDSLRTGELLRRRDELTAQIEALLAARRQESVVIDRQIEELDAARDALALRTEELRRQVRALADELDAAGARARYDELSRVAAEAEGRQAADQWAPRVEELDDQIARWRATLAELESREATLRAELAHVRPDDAAPQLLLADQRASVAVAQRLVADLESEVARFARSGGSPVCLCKDAHPRLNPLVETLGRHVHRLAELVAQQDDALRTQELLAEAGQLNRSQAELRRQLDHLLERRQTLWRSSRARVVRTELAGAPYATGYDRGALEREHRDLSEQLDRLDAELAGLDRERHDYALRRERLIDAGQLGQWQRELDALQADLARQAESPLAHPADGSLRASDVLARLTDGDLNELRLAPGGRSVEARDCTGRLVRQGDFTPTEERLVGWALRLALADASHASGIAFPLLLDRPFAGLGDSHAANLATCLDDYARRDRQVLVFSEENAGLARLRALGAGAPSLRGAAPLVETPRPAPLVPATIAPVTQVREVVREEEVARALLLDVEDPIDRFPVRFEGREQAFARARIRQIGDLVSGDPSAIAEELATEGVTPELVALWQAHLALVCFTPGLELRDAKLLSECDILSVEELAGADADRLAEALRRRGATSASLEQVPDWIEAASDGLERWNSSGYAASWRRNRGERRERIRDNASRRTRSEGQGERGERAERGERRERSSRDERKPKRSTRDEKPAKPRFYLEPDSDVEAAPSIGPKRAQQLASLGVRRVSQLLAADPQDLAARLADSRIDAAAVVAWQHQAGLMCRVPGLRGHDAQVLVGSGFTSADELAGMKPAELLDFVEPFCDSPEGQRALQGSPRPDLAEVTQWVQAARQRRSASVA